MVDKRKDTRKHLSLYLRVYDTGTNEMAGHLVDMTPEGVRILSDTPLEPGALYHFRLDLSAVMNFEQRVVFEARCLWREQEFSSGAWNCGFEILKITGKGREIIEQLVTQFGD